MEDMDIDVVNKLRGSAIDAGPCRIARERFDYLNKCKYERDLSQQEIADYLGYKFYQSFGYNLDWNNPVTCNEKLNWLKLHYHNPLMSQCADKATFNDFLASRLPGLEAHYVKKLAILHSPEELTEDLLASLPDRFIMKSNFGSGAQQFVERDKALLPDLKKEIFIFLHPHANHYYVAFEYGYRDIAPAVVIEPVISFDYKIEFYCFDGEPFMYWVVLNDKTQNVRANIYTMRGHQIKAVWKYKNFNEQCPQPPYFQDLVNAAKILSTGFPHARVDFFAARDAWYFSEITFYTWAGLMPLDPYELDVFLGGKINLDKLKPGLCA